MPSARAALDQDYHRQDIAVDASVAVSLIQNDVQAYVGGGLKVETTAAEDTIETDTGEK